MSIASKIVREFRDLEFVVVASAGEYHVDYWIYDILGIEVGTEKVLYHKAGGDGCDPVENIDEAEVYMHGSVKWDGCSNWNLQLDDDCSRVEIGRISAILAACWDMTAKLLPKWDKSVAEHG